MTAPSPDTLVLIDGHALAYRSYFALPPLHNSQGEATHAILGFLRHTLRLARQASNQVIVVFDPPVKTFRHEQYGDYKSGRAQTPDDLPAQINRIREIVDALGWPRLEEPGYEADDVIATLTKMAEGRGFQVRIVTSDRDAYQLLDDHVRVLASDFSLIGPDEVLAKYGVTVRQWVDYRALTGDASDNIPGAKGIGPKTAAKLLQEYGTLDAVLAAAQAGTLEPKGTREKLLASEADVLFSRELSCMVTDLPLKVELGTARGAGDPRRLEELLDELELASLKRDVLGLSKGTQDADAPDAPTNPDTFQAPQIAEWRTPGAGVTWGYVLSREDDLTADLIAAATFDGKVARVAPVEERAGSTAEAVAVLDTAAPSGPLFSDPQADEAPKKLTKKEQQAAEKAARAVQKAAERQAALFPPTVSEAEFIGQRTVTAAGAKALAAHLSVRGTQIEPGDDPLLVAYLLDPANTNMPTVAERYLHTAWPDDAATRAAIAYRLLGELPPQLDEARRKLYEDVEKPLSAVLKRMEVRGVRLDSDYLRGLSEATAGRIASLEAEIHRLAGREFAIRSRDQLEAVLYDELGLASGKKTKLTGKRSTAVSALEPLRNEHPIIPALLEYRELEKLRGTYLDPLPNLVNPHTGRLHTTFNQTTAATGRLSSLNPNLQNIPIRSELGREIRKGFIADEGYCLISADYSQIELRLLAAISGDELMRQAFREGADIHRRTAAQVLGLAEDAITPNQRRAAKTVNFGVLYGMSAHRLSNELAIPYTEAASFIEVYFSTYPGIRRYIERTLEFGREHGYVETLYGRRRYVPELKSQNRTLREAGERLAYNMPIQGTAADIIKIAMVRLADELDALGARLLLQVHDELLIEAPEDRAEDIARLTCKVMENAAHLSVPLAVEVGIGPNWYDTK
ncbi:DNA polymerase I [Deinococcus metallilatus]|uniref:DNA polymerase I n=1 Tax=Deinococcus metallilatus TaxID=1211322 RepID=A0AAJ5K4P7_9DEIO|nr:DNA polymerase I [Deinococcus metallilatus]MBB5295975.1 DNA polymerase-1 [Deinococcus metallilatus]QBY08202.1 DNA polymerase I [Deinococcus metallilatus]RXJ11933.1 DNA polymerase I [Deinococcus metallilatus]TLK25835.1 DNA polymerase I [Deinococcus metallilatus]GMA14490.1 DNA polymerase I [Deinococcus metallilatus]